MTGGPQSLQRGPHRLVDCHQLMVSDAAPHPPRQNGHQSCNLYVAISTCSSSSSYLLVMDVSIFCCCCLMFVAVAAKVRNLHEFHLRLYVTSTSPPTGQEISNTLKFFSQTLLGEIMKYCNHEIMKS